METYKERVRLFERLLGPQAPADVDLEAFRQLCYQGIPDDARIRPRSWKILLNYTPYDERSRWEEILRTKRETYYTFVKELVRDPTDEEVAWGKNRDHPLNDANNSKWQMYFEELKILEQIDKDVRRTLPDFGFFQLPVPPSHLSPLHFATKDKPASASSNTDSKTTNGTELKGTRNSKPFSPIQTRRALFKRLENMYPGNDFGARSHPGSNSASDLPTSGSPASDETPSIPDRVEGEQGDLHWEAIERILFVYARLNPGIGYVQGMNEILGPLYYVMATDPDEEHRAHAEADSFFTFSALISEFRDHFIRSLDNVQATPTGRRASQVERSTSSSSLPPLTPEGDNASGERKQKQPPRTLGARQGSMGELMMERTSGNGIGNSMARMMKRIKRRDPEVYQDLQQKGIHAAFFSFRWITCLLTQEYALPDLIQLWDSILADLALDINTGSSPTASSEGINSNAASPKRSADGYLREGRFDFLIDVCCAMVVCVRDDILSGSFSDTVRLLQNYPVSDVNIVLRQAFAFREDEREDYSDGDESGAKAFSKRVPPGSHFRKILYRGDLYAREQERQRHIADAKAAHTSRGGGPGKDSNSIAAAQGGPRTGGKQNPRVLWTQLLTTSGPMANPFKAGTNGAAAEGMRKQLATQPSSPSVLGSSSGAGSVAGPPRPDPSKTSVGTSSSPGENIAIAAGDEKDSAITAVKGTLSGFFNRVRNSTALHTQNPAADLSQPPPDKAADNSTIDANVDLAKPTDGELVQGSSLLPTPAQIASSSDTIQAQAANTKTPPATLSSSSSAFAKSFGGFMRTKLAASSAAVNNAVTKLAAAKPIPNTTTPNTSLNKERPGAEVVWVSPEDDNSTRPASPALDKLHPLPRLPSAASDGAKPPITADVNPADVLPGSDDVVGNKEQVGATNVVAAV